MVDDCVVVVHGRDERLRYCGGRGRGRRRGGAVEEVVGEDVLGGRADDAADPAVEGVLREVPEDGRLQQQRTCRRLTKRSETGGGGGGGG